jgi:hypothetical protein
MEIYMPDTSKAESKRLPFPNEIPILEKYTLPTVCDLPKEPLIPISLTDKIESFEEYKIRRAAMAAKQLEEDDRSFYRELIEQFVNDELTELIEDGINEGEFTRAGGKIDLCHAGDGMLLVFLDDPYVSELLLCSLNERLRQSGWRAQLELDNLFVKIEPISL